MAELWTDILSPAEQTAYARRSLQEVEEAKGSLSAWLPSRLVDDITLRFVRTRGGLVPTAEYRSFDAETTIGSLPGGERVTIDLAPLGHKIRLGELDQLRARGNATTNAQQDLLGVATDRVVSAIADRLEVARGAVLDTGRLTIDENGFKVDYDLGRKSEHSVTAANMWSSEDANPLEDIQSWAETYENENGDLPGALLVSGKVRSLLRKNKAFRSMSTTPTTPDVVSLDFINATLQAEGLPALTVYNRRASVGGKVTRILPENKVFLLPAPGTGELGGVYLGTTLEASEPGYGIAAGERAGIVVGTFRDNDPIATWVHGAAIGLPALIAPNASMVATVLGGE